MGLGRPRLVSTTKYLSDTTPYDIRPDSLGMTFTQLVWCAPTHGVICVLAPCLNS